MNCNITSGSIAYEILIIFYFHDISHVQPAMRTTNKKKLFWASLCVIAILFLVGLSLYRVYLNKLADEGYFEPPVYHLTPAEARTFDPDEYFPGN